MGLIRKLQNRFNIKPRAVKLAEAIIDLLPPEEWERMNAIEGRSNIEDIRDWMISVTEGATCCYTMRSALKLAEYTLETAKLVPPADARIMVIELLSEELLTYLYW